MAKLKQAIQAAEQAVERAAETLWVEIVSPVIHDGERLAIGAVHAIERGAAEALIAIGAAKPAKQDTKS